MISLALEVDESPVYRDILLLSDEVGVELLATEGLLEVLERNSTDSLGVGEKGLVTLVLERQEMANTCG